MSSVQFKLNHHLPGDPENSVKGDTTVSGGNTVLSAIAQQSFNTHRRPCKRNKTFGATFLLSIY